MGAVLLSLPVAKAGGGMAPPLVALFTSASAVSVTGLITVDTATYWTPFGQAVILALFQIGGFGIMTAAVVLGLVAGRDIRLRDRLVTQVERSRLAQGNARSVLYLIFFVTLFIEGEIALILAIRLHAAYDHGWGEAIWHGLFHSVSAFNNAGFSSYSDSVMGFQQDAWVLGPIMLAVVISSLGFPVMQELRNRPLAREAGRCTQKSP
jgi:trk system potassium uptake protein TrkH